MANADACSIPAAAPTPSEMPRGDYWQGLIDECHRSGLSQAAFCRAHGIARRSLNFWKRKLSGGAGDGASAVSDPAGAQRPPAFVPVQVVSTRRPHDTATLGSPPVWEGEIEIVLASGRLVRVRGRVDGEWLRQVIGMAEATRG